MVIVNSQWNNCSISIVHYQALTRKRVLLLVVVEWKTPDVGLVWLAAVRLEAHTQHGERVPHQGLLHRLGLHEVMIVRLERPRLQNEHIARNKELSRMSGMKENESESNLLISPSIESESFAFIDGFS